MQPINSLNDVDQNGPVWFKVEGATKPRVRRAPNVRQRLRQATAAIHQTMHEHASFVRLVEGRMTLSDYRALLARLYGFHWPLERGLRLAPAEVVGEFNLRERERSQDLRADLRALGMTSADIDSLPLCLDLPPVRSNAELLGRLYVVEGAGLGGRVLASKLDGLLGEHGTDGRQFFSERHAPDPLPWPVFCGWLEARGVDVRTVVGSAQTTFETMAHWLAESEPNV